MNMLVRVSVQFVLLVSAFANVSVARPAWAEAEAPQAPAALILTVDRTDDPILSPPSACTAAGNDCSLRGAIIKAHQNPGSTILVPVMMNLDLTDYTIVITQPMTITGQSNPGAVVTAKGYTRTIFLVEVTGTLNLNWMALVNGGGTNGGAIFNKGTVRIDNGAVYSNAVTGWGGAILNDENASLSLSNTQIYRSVAGAYGGGILNNGGVVEIVNSSIYSNVAMLATGGVGNGNSFADVGIGRMTIAGSKIMSNTSWQSGPGGINNGSVLTVTNSLIQGNRGEEGGGIGIGATNARTVLAGVTVVGNVAISGSVGGGIANRGVLTLTGGLILTNTATGAGGGGGLYNLGHTTIDATSFMTNAAPRGGAIRSQGFLTVTNSLFRRNVATDTAGISLQESGYFDNVDVVGNLGSGLGGAGGFAQVFNSKFISNTGNALSPGSGAYLVEDTLVMQNGGGAFSGSPSGQNIFNRVGFISNTTTYGGAISGYGAFTVTDGVMVGNAAFQGGAINVYAPSGRVRLLRTLVQANSASGGAPGTSHGGAVYNGNVFEAEDLVFTENYASNGQAGVIWNNAGASASLLDVTLLDNLSSHGGGGIVNAGWLTLTASTVYTNGTLGNGGAISNSGSLRLVNATLSDNAANGMGGGLFNVGGAAVLFNATVTRNKSPNIGNGIAVTAGVVTLTNSAVAGNLGGECAGTLQSGGYNLLGDWNCTFNNTTGDVQNGAPLLGALGYNGGSTPTHVPLPGSPLINAANPAGCTDGLGGTLARDQRGVLRPQLGRCDIGATEWYGYRTFVPATLRGASTGW